MEKCHKSLINKVYLKYFTMGQIAQKLSYNDQLDVDHNIPRTIENPVGMGTFLPATAKKPALNSQSAFLQKSIAQNQPKFDGIQTPTSTTQAILESFATPRLASILTQEAIKLGNSSDETSEISNRKKLLMALNVLSPRKFPSYSANDENLEKNEEFNPGTILTENTATEGEIAVTNTQRPDTKEEINTPFSRTELDIENAKNKTTAHHIKIITRSNSRTPVTTESVKPPENQKLPALKILRPNFKKTKITEEKILQTSPQSQPETIATNIITSEEITQVANPYPKTLESLKGVHPPKETYREEVDVVEPVSEPGNKEVVRSANPYIKYMEANKEVSSPRETYREDPNDVELIQESEDVEMNTFTSHSAQQEQDDTVTETNTPSLDTKKVETPTFTDSAEEFVAHTLEQSDPNPTTKTIENESVDARGAETSPQEETLQTTHSQEGEKEKRAYAVGAVVDIFSDRFTSSAQWGGPTAFSVNVSNNDESFVENMPVKKTESWRDTLETKVFLNDVTTMTEQALIAKYIPSYVKTNNPSSWASVSGFSAYEIIHGPEVVYGLDSDNRLELSSLIKNLGTLDEATGVIKYRNGNWQNYQEYLDSEQKLTIHEYYEAIRAAIAYSDKLEHN